VSGEQGVEPTSPKPRRVMLAFYVTIAVVLAFAVASWFAWVSPRDRNWRLYRERYADRELEISSGMVKAAERGAIRVISEGYTQRSVERVDSQGNVVWSVEMPPYIPYCRPRPWLRFKSTVIVARGDGLVSVEFDTGKTLWTSEGPNNRLAVAGNLVLAACHSSTATRSQRAVARNGDTGKLEWKLRLPGSGEPHAIVAGGGLIWITGSDERKGYTYVVDRQGTLLRQFPECVSSFHSAGGKVVIASEKRIAALDPRAKTVWEILHDHNDEWPCGMTGICPGPGRDFLVYFFGAICDSGVHVWRVCATDGKILWKKYCPGLQISHSKYSHAVYVHRVRGELVVVSQGASYFVEVLSIETGKRVRRFQFERNLKKEGWR
jgi:outer membrane protein assembly factor BamB